MSKINGHDSKIRFECPTCKAQPWQPCTDASRVHSHGLRPHTSRLDRYAAWAIREAVAAADAGYEDENEDEPTTAADRVGSTPLRISRRSSPRQCSFLSTPLSGTVVGRTRGC